MNSKMRIGLLITIFPVAIMILIGIILDDLPDSLFLPVFWTAFPLGTGLLIWGFKDLIQGPKKLLATGTLALATIDSVRRTGAVINDVNLVVEIRLNVQPEGKPPYIAKIKTLVPIHQPDSFEVGQRVPVRYDPRRPARVAIDPNPPAEWIARVGRPTPSALSQEEILSKGNAAIAQIIGLTLTGRTAGQLSGDDTTHPERAHYPAILLELIVQPEGDESFTYQALYAVPPEKTVGLARESIIPVKYLKHDGQPLVAVEWGRV